MNRHLCLDLRCSRFITFGMFSIRPAKSRAFRLGKGTAPAGTRAGAVIPVRQAETAGASIQRA